jgi:hypothetical protein
LVITFFATCRVERARGLRSGLASGLASELAFFGLRGVTGLAFAGLLGATALAFGGLRGATGSFIRKSIKTYKYNQFYLLGSVLINNTESIKMNSV